MKRSFALTEAGAVGSLTDAQVLYHTSVGFAKLTDARRYYTTLQFWTGDRLGRWGASQNGGGFGACLWPATRAAGETPAFPGGCPQIWTTPRQMGCIQDIWRASRPILSTTPGAGGTPAILKVLCIGVGNESLSAKKPSNPGGYAIISDAPGSDSSSGAAFEEPASPRELQDGITHRAANCNDCGSLLVRSGELESRWPVDRAIVANQTVRRISHTVPDTMPQVDLLPRVRQPVRTVGAR